MVADVSLGWLRAEVREGGMKGTPSEYRKTDEPLQPAWCPTRFGEVTGISSCQILRLGGLVVGQFEIGLSVGVAKRATHVSFPVLKTSVVKAVRPIDAYRGRAFFVKTCPSEGACLLPYRESLMRVDLDAVLPYPVVAFHIERH